MDILHNKSGLHEEPTGGILQLDFFMKEDTSSQDFTEELTGGILGLDFFRKEGTRRTIFQFSCRGNILTRIGGIGGIHGFRE